MIKLRNIILLKLIILIYGTISMFGISCDRKISHKQEIDNKNIIVDNDSCIIITLDTILPFQELKTRANLIFSLDFEISEYKNLCYLIKKKHTNQLFNLQFDIVKAFHSDHFYPIDTIEGNYFKNLFEVFDYNISIPPDIKILAIGYDGELFHLKGFQNNEYNFLISHYFKKLNSKTALELCKLYLTLQPFYEQFHFEILDRNKYNLKLHPEITKPIIKKLSNNQFSIQFFDEAGDTLQIRYHDFRISNKGILYHNESVIYGKKDFEFY